MLCEDTRLALLHICRGLPAEGLATGSTGNISAYDAETGYIVIKCSSVPYAEMTEEDFAILDRNGEVIELRAGRRPSIETPTHLELYRKFPEVGAVLHTHMKQAIVLASFYDEIQCNLTPTGRRLLKKPVPVIPFIENGTQEMADVVAAALSGRTGVVIRNHGPFMVGGSISEAYQRTIALRDVCELFYEMSLIGKPSLIP